MQALDQPTCISAVFPSRLQMVFLLTVGLKYFGPISNTVSESCFALVT